ncbi:hypothetical protein GCM10010401_02780 [Rarobacter faecitabidus]
MRHRILSVLTALLMIIVGTVVVAPGAHAATIMIDDYAGTVLGSRSASTVGSGSFTQSGGLGVFTAQGAGNTAGSATISYAIPTRDLTDSGLNKQFFLEFTDINRTNRPNAWDTAANISISVTGGGITGVYSSGIANTDGPFNFVFNMDCNVTGGACFSPMPNFTSVTAISVTVAYPRNYDTSGGVLTAKLDQIRTTPLGGGVPAAPSVSISQPTGNPVYVKQGDTLTFPVTVSLGQGATLVNGLASNEVSLSGTAGGTISSVTGSGTSYTVTVTGISTSGTVKVNVVAGAIVDSWDQVNAASSSNSVNVVYVVPPVFRPPASFTWVKGQAATGSINVQSADPNVAYALDTGSLPTGVSLNSSTGALTGTPTATGSFSPQIKATNIAGSATASFSIQVNEVPAITSTSTATFMAGQAGSFSVTATGIPQSSITIGSLPAGLSVATQSGSTRVISGTPTTPGSTVVSVDATNSAGSVHQDLTVNVNQRPIFGVAPTSQNLLVNQAAAVDLPFTAFPAPTASLATGSLPAGLSLSIVGGVARISGTPSLAAAGTHTLTVRLTNAHGSADHALTLNIGSPAAITSANTSTVTVGQPANIAVTASGVPTPAITVTGLPTGLTWTDNGTGAGSITGSVATTGTYSATVTAANSSGPNATQNLTIRVVQGPAITSAAAATLTQGTAASFTVTTTGYPTAAITRTGTLPSGMSFIDNGDGTAKLSGTPTQFGVFPLTITATNPDFPAVTQVLTITVHGAPVLAATPDRTGTTGTSLSFNLSATGLPVPSLTVAGLPSGLSSTDNGDGTITVSGTPAASAGGVYTVTVTATNSVGTVNRDFTLTVSQAPAITSAAGATLTRGIAGQFQFAATGYPAADIALTGSLPTGLTLGTSANGTRTLSGTPLQHGVFPLTVTASNGVGVEATQTFTLRVEGAPVLGTAPDRTAQTGISTDFAITSDALPIASFDVTGLPSGLAASEENGTLTISGTPAGGTGGNYDVNVTATNSVGSVGTSFTLTVRQPAAVTSAAATTLTRGSAGSFTVQTTGYPAPALDTTGMLPAGVTFHDNGNGTATLSGSPTEHGTFPVTITATGEVGEPAVQSFLLTVEGAPIIEQPADRVAQTGVPTQFSVVASAVPAATLNVTGLPAGLAFAEANGVAMISGTPSAGVGGTYQVSVTATNALGTDDSSFTLTVNQPPAMTSAVSATFTRGVAGSFTLSSTGYPAATLTIAGALPNGLTFEPGADGTAVLSGTPTEDGTFTPQVTAGNGIGTAVQQTLTVTVNGEPAVTGGVVIEGSGKAGEPLTIDSDLASSVAGAQLSGHWLRDGLVIPDADEATWTPSNSDAGSLITYEVTVTAPGFVPLTVPSVNDVEVIGIISAESLQVTGTPQVDELLSADLAGLDPSDSSVTFSWSIDGDVVASGPTYSPRAADVGSSIDVTAFVTRPNFQDLTVSESLSPVVVAQFATAPAVAWTGTAQVRQRLTAVTQDSVPAAEATALQWYANGEPIAGATQDELELSANLKGKRISVKVTVTRRGYAEAIATSTESGPVATDSAPAITLRSNATSLRRGAAARLTWSTSEATRVYAGGAWRGTVAASGSAAVTPTSIGANVYSISASNHIGTTTAQVVVKVRRPKAKVAISFPDRLYGVTTKVRVKIGGLDAGEAFKVRIGGIVVGKGRADAKGKATMAVRVPKRRAGGSKIINRSHIRVFGEEKDRQGIVKLRVTRHNLLAKKALKVRLGAKRVHASDSQTIVVRGLGRREPVTVVVNGIRVSKPNAKADVKGRYRVVLKNVGRNWGTRVVKVKAPLSARSKSVRFTVSAAS